MSDIVERLRKPRVTHHQISEDWETYATAKKTHPVEAIKEEAALEIESLRSQLAAVVLERDAAVDRLKHITRVKSTICYRGYGYGMGSQDGIDDLRSAIVRNGHG